MARIDKKKNLRASVFDRLMDNDPSNQAEAEKSKHQQIQALRASVRRDLEHLLNTRYRVVSPPEEYKNVESSILNYGLPDLATINILSPSQKKDFVYRLEKILRDFEPRFKSVRVQFVENSDSSDRTLRFRIDATLYADPAPETIVFDSILEPVTRTVNVAESQYG